MSNCQKSSTGDNSADRIQPAMIPAPYGWTVTGTSTIWRGEYAEQDAQQEACHIGGDCAAIPLYLHPAAQSQEAEMARLREASWKFGDAMTEMQGKAVRMRGNIANLRAALSQSLMALEGYQPGHRNAVTDSAIASARAALSRKAT
jgi:hypothetical protein